MHPLLAAASLAACLALAGCAPGDQARAAPYCDDYARTHGTLTGVHYSIAAHLDEEDALRAYCMRMLNGS